MCEMTDEYYKEDLCKEDASCKLYNPLLTQGQCEYYNQWCELKKENKRLYDALYWAGDFIARHVADRDVKALPHEWAEHFIEKAIALDGIPPYDIATYVREQEEMKLNK